MSVASSPVARRMASRVVGAALAVMLVITATATSAAPPRGDQLAFAVRGDQVQLIAPPPEPAPILYPESRCQEKINPAVPSPNPAQPPLDHRIIGYSVEGRAIWAELWGNPAATRTVLVVGQTHGYECAPFAVISAMRRTDLPYRLWIVATINPDGMVRLERNNVNNVDLNADGGRQSQPETRAIRDFIATQRPDLAVFVHSPNGFAGPYPTVGEGATACQRLAVAVALRCSNTAGVRPTSRWFLWQMARAVSPSTDSLLVEAYAVGATEVTNARPRPPHRSVAEAIALGAALAQAVA